MLPPGYGRHLLCETHIIGNVWSIVICRKSTTKCRNSLDHISHTVIQTTLPWAPPRFFLGGKGRSSSLSPRQWVAREFAYKLTFKPTLRLHLKLFSLTILEYSGQNNIFFNIAIFIINIWNISSFFKF
jgi:hypothetical protein